jgi:hypothetical protein
MNMTPLPLRVVQARVWRGIQIDAEYFWKFIEGAYDFDVILNTPLAFPVQFRKSRIDGGLVRVRLPELHGWRLGGLRFSADYAPWQDPTMTNRSNPTHISSTIGMTGQASGPA